MKRTLVIIGAIILILIIAVGIYYFLARSGNAPIPKQVSFLFPNTDTDIPGGGQGGGTTTNEVSEETTTGGGDNGQTSGSENGSEVNTQQPQTAKFFKQITKNPVAASPTIFGRLSNKSLVVRFVEKETGRIYEYRPITSQLSRLTITTIPRVQESLFTKDGSLVFLRYFDESNGLNNYLGNLPKPTSTPPIEGTLEGAVVNKNIISIAASPSSNSFAYTESLDDGNANVVVGLPSQTKGNRTVAKIPLSDWLIYWPKDDTLQLQSMPAAGVYGLLYNLKSSTTNGGILSLQKVLANIYGLTVSGSRNLNQIIYSASTKDGMTASVFDPKTRTSKDLPIITLPEKCVWDMVSATRVYCAAPENLPTAKYPDEWYKGGITFNDLLWDVDTEKGSASVLFTPRTEAGTSLDMTSLAVAQDASYLVFVNKKDGSLWGFDLAAYRNEYSY